MFAEKPLVTVYIPSRNYGQFLGTAIASVRAQLYPYWELIVIDEASEDDTSAIAELACKEDPKRIRVLKHETALGLQRTANCVLGMARGRYIIRLDADDWLDESALLLLVAKLESDPDLGLAYGNFYYVDEKGHVIGVERRRKLGVEDVSGHLPPHGACTMVRTRLLKLVGGYSEDVNAQDGWELWFKLLHRTKAASIDAPLFYYRQHGSSLSRDSSRLLDARARIMEKVGGGIKGGYIPSCLAVIPVRESYPEIEGVPYQEIDGKSLLQIAIESAQQATGVTKVAISSSADEVLDFARDMEAKEIVKPHMRIIRPRELDTLQIQLREVLEHTAKTYNETNGGLPDIVLFLSLHAPMRRPAHVEKAINTLRVVGADSVVSVCEEREPIFIHGQQGLNLLNPGRFNDLTLERERLFRFNGAILGVWTEVLLNGSLFGNSIGYIEMSQADSLQIKHVSDLKSISIRIQNTQTLHHKI